MSQNINAQVNDNIVYLIGSIKSAQWNYNHTSNNYLIGTLPTFMKPQKRLIFIVNENNTYRLDITPEGNVILLTPSITPININLNGIRYSLKVKKPLSLINQWQPSGENYQYPSVTRHGSIVYLSGIIKNGFFGANFTTLPIDYCPQRKEIFYIGGLYPSNNTTGGCLCKIKILPTGECSIYNLAKNQNKGWYSLEGLQFTVDNSQSINLKLLPKYQIYDRPQIFSENGNIQLKGLIQTRGDPHDPPLFQPQFELNSFKRGSQGEFPLIQTDSHLIGQLPERLAPDRQLFFFCPNVIPAATFTCILIDEKGNIRKIQGPHSAIICFSNISYIKFPNNNTKQIGGSNNQITIGNLIGFEQFIVDGAQNIQLIDLHSPISKQGKITEWQFDAGRIGEVLLQVYRPVTVDRSTGNGNYKLIGEYSYTAKQLGLNQIIIPQNFQIEVQVGDYIGWRYPGLGVIKFQLQSGNVRWLYGNSPGMNQLVSFIIGEPRTYAYLVTIQVMDASQKVGNCEIITGFDFPENDIISTATTSIDECASKCQQTIGCQGFARSNSNGDCWLKSKMDNKTPNGDRSGGICTMTPIPKQIGNCEIIPGFDFPGNDINHSVTATLQECATKCQQNPQCVGFSRLDGNGQCWIKTNMVNKTPYKNLTSGICSIPPSQSQTLLSQINQNEVGGSINNPARSAQHIIDDYSKKKLNYPPDGTYWIRVFDYLQPQQIYCNFSIRKGHGYMLVGSVTDQLNWLPANDPAMPLNPYFHYGLYQVDGKLGNYYRAWNDLDLNTILDTEPDKCQTFGYKYSTDGQFCGKQINQSIQRLNLNGGISEFLFVTGNYKYWTVFPKIEIPGQVFAEVWKKIPVIASSQNFEGTCDPNNSIFIVSRPKSPEDPWINAGDAHKCGNNYMFWGLNNYSAHQNFKNKNGGVQFYIGGPVTQVAAGPVNQVAGEPNNFPQPQSFPHNPTHHLAPNKKTYESTYTEAQSVCSTMGKKICSKDELTIANRAGYSSCACGWTETMIGNQHWVGYPTNMDQWINLNRGAEKNVQGGWCGIPGINQCGLIDANKGIWDHPGADIYCCDRFDFNPNFDLLDPNYIQAKLWIGEIETLFNNMYGQLIPSPIDILVYGLEGFGIAVTKRGQSYDLINNENGKAPQKLANIRCQLPILIPYGLDRRAIFLSDLTQYEIMKGEIWPINTGKLLTLTFGSHIRLSNIFNNTLLTTQEINYYHIGSSKKTQIMGTHNEDNSSLWLIKTQRGLGKIDLQGFGDEKYNFGQPIQNGSIIRLESILSTKNLHSNAIYQSPSGRQEIYLNQQGKFGDSNDHWKVELLQGSHWKTNTPFRLIHVNTNTVLYSDSTTYQPSQNSNLKYIEVAANNSRGSGDTWKIHSYVLGQLIKDPCHEMTENIKKINLQIQSINQQKPQNDTKLNQQLNDLLTQKKILVNQYNIECRKLSIFEYKNNMNQKETEIQKVMDQYDLERKKLEQINSQWISLSQKQNNLDQQYQISEKQYQQLLRSHCLPVTTCLPPSGHLTIPSQCQHVMNQLDHSKGIITNQIASQIENILVGQDDVTKYDIKDHPEFYKLIENSKIQACPRE